VKFRDGPAAVIGDERFITPLFVEKQMGRQSLSDDPKSEDLPDKEMYSPWTRELQKRF